MEYGRLKPPSSLGDDSSEPIWHLRLNPLDTSADSGATTTAEPVDGVDGAFFLPNVLTAAECAALISVVEKIGFTSGETLVEVPREVRSNDVAVVVVPAATTAALSARLKPFVDAKGHDCRGMPSHRIDPDFVNCRWRFYRYLPCGDDGEAQRFGPHYDGAQPLSAIKDGQLVDAVPPRGIVRLSQLTVLLYLNDGHAGGETVFYPDGDPSSEGIRVAPRRGGAELLILPMGGLYKHVARKRK